MRPQFGRSLVLPKEWERRRRGDREKFKIQLSALYFPDLRPLISGL